MMYRHETQQRDSRREHGGKRSRGNRRRTAFKSLSSLVVVAGVLFAAWALISFVTSQKTDNDTVSCSLVGAFDGFRDDVAVADRVYRRRLRPDAVPYLDANRIDYRGMFNDSNYVHLSAARANGIDPEALDDPAAMPGLVPVFTTATYRVDTMYHAVPYLVPEAVLLLDYISTRFAQLMEDNYPQIGEHKIILTSALRTEQSERRLRRVNRNATDTSCHLYGTTFDLSAQRYEHVESGRDTVVEACKRMLAKALYELRYEGLCYVKYERGSCFHITLRTTGYEGAAAADTCCYINPGSPSYLLTKAPERPKPRAAAQSKQTVEKQKARKKEPAASSDTRTKKANKKSNKKKEKQEVARTEEASRGGSHSVTERERLSLEQFERRY